MSSDEPHADLAADLRAATEADLRRLFDDYVRLYAARDDRLTGWFSDTFSGFTGGGDFLVQDREAWVAITRRDFAQVKEPLKIELKDLAVQSLAETVAVATGFFTIRLPIQDHILSRETARLVLIFRREAAGWKIAHSSISIPYPLVRDGEVYPLQDLTERNRVLEELVAGRTAEISAANAALLRGNEALRQSEERYRSILRASPDDITITDRDGRIVLVSPMAAKIFRCAEPEKFMGAPLSDFLVPEDRVRAAAQVARKLQGDVTGPGEYRGLRPDGSVFDIEVNSEFIRDADGAPSGLVVIVRDISGRKQAEADRKRLEAENRQLQKAESLGRMAGAIAHHFNNQLHAVIGHLELALGELPADSAARPGLVAALQAAGKATEIGRQMITYLGHADVRGALLDLAGTCREGLRLVRVLLPPGVTLEADLPVAGPFVRADANQLQQVMTNLIVNAWEAMTEGRRAIRLCIRTVEAAEIPATHRFPVDRAPAAGPHACLEVADSGCGIAPADFEKLFDPFFSRKFTGRGLGLAVVLGIVRAHGGVVTVESALGRGSVFQVFLPLPADAESLPLARDGKSACASPRTLPA